MSYSPIYLYANFCRIRSFGSVIVYRDLKDKRDAQGVTFTPDQLRNLGVGLLKLCYSMADQKQLQGQFLYTKLRDYYMTSKRKLLAQKRQGKEILYQDVPGMTNQVYSNGEED